MILSIISSIIYWAMMLFGSVVSLLVTAVSLFILWHFSTMAIKHVKEMPAKKEEYLRYRCHGYYVYDIKCKKMFDNQLFLTESEAILAISKAGLQDEYFAQNIYIWPVNYYGQFVDDDIYYTYLNYI